MRTVKPLRVGVLTRPYGYLQQSRLGVLVYTLVDFNGTTPRLVPEAEITSHLLPQMDCQGILDLVLPKTQAEFLVSGSAYTTHQQDKTQCAVRVQVGELEKNLLVFGDRYWLDNRITAPQPFDTMPVTWANAFGGQGFEENPEGKGIGREWVNGVWTTRLPNIESPTARIGEVGHRPAPAGLGPVMINRPRRYQHVGSFSDTWMKTDITGFFPDMDTRLFSAAEQDQRWNKRDSLPTGAPFSVWNMHPEQACWSGHIPDWVPRCFVRQRNAAGTEDFLEVGLKATTLWLLPGIRHAIMMYHGSIGVTETYAEDVSAIMAAMELPGQPRDPSYYEEIFDLRSDMEKGALYALRDRDLVPRSIMGDWLDTRLLNTGVLLANAGRREQREREETRAELRDTGVDISTVMPELMGPEFPISAEYLPELHERMLQQKGAATQQAEEEKIRIRKQLEDRSDAQPMDPEMAEKLRRIVEGETPASTLDDMKDAMAKLETLQTQIEEKASDSGQRELSRQQMKKINLYSAHLLPQGIAVGKHIAEQKRDIVVTRYGSGQDLCNLDLSGADLSGLDLQGADFSGSDLSDANLRGATLDRCTFIKTLLVRSVIEDTSFQAAVFRDSSLGATTLLRANLAGARLQAVIMQKTVFSHCDLRESQWQDVAQTTKAQFISCRFEKANVIKTIFTDCCYLNTSFAQAQFSQVAFQVNTLENVTFEKASLISITFVASSLQNISFIGAHMEGASFTYKVQINTCSFKSANMKNSSFNRSTLNQVDFSTASIRHCDFSEASLQAANFSACNATGSIFRRCDLRLASFSSADLTGSNFQQADMRGTDMRRANLCTADISETWLDDRSHTQGAFLKYAKLYPLRKQSSRFWEQQT